MHIKTIAKAKFKEARESYLARIRDAPSEQISDPTQKPPYKWLPSIQSDVEPKTTERQSQGSTGNLTVALTNDGLSDTSTRPTQALPPPTASLSLASSDSHLTPDVLPQKRHQIHSLPQNANDLLRSQAASSATFSHSESNPDPAVALDVRFGEVPKSKFPADSQLASTPVAPSPAPTLDNRHVLNTPLKSPIASNQLSASNLQHIGRSTADSNGGVSQSVSRNLSSSTDAAHVDLAKATVPGRAEMRTVDMPKPHKKRSEAEMLKIDHHPAYFLQEEEVSATERTGLPVKRRRKILGTWVESESDDPMDEDYSYANHSGSSEHGRSRLHNSIRGNVRLTGRRANQARGAVDVEDVGQPDETSIEARQVALPQKLPKVILRLGPRPPNNNLQGDDHTVRAEENIPVIPDGVSIVAQTLWLHSGVVEHPASSVMSPVTIRPTL